MRSPTRVTRRLSGWSVGNTRDFWRTSAYACSPRANSCLGVKASDCLRCPGPSPTEPACSQPKSPKGRRQTVNNERRRAVRGISPFIRETSQEHLKAAGSPGAGTELVELEQITCRYRKPLREKKSMKVALSLVRVNAFTDLTSGIGNTYLDEVRGTAAPLTTAVTTPGVDV